MSSLLRVLVTALTSMSLITDSIAAAEPAETYTPPYKTLPPAKFRGTARINNISLWYSMHGPPLTCGRLPIVFLHGRKTSSRWWGYQIKYVASTIGNPVIAIDTRAHGGSSDDISVPLTYEQFAHDATALLKHLKVARTGVVGRSDGANTALSMAMHHGEVLDRAFVFGANYRPDQLNITGLMGIMFLKELAGRQQSEWEALTPTGQPKNYAALAARVSAMQETAPMWDGSDFGRIKTLYQDPRKAPIVWVADGDSEEIVQRQVAGDIRDGIWGSSLVMLPDVGHFAPLQDPEMFNVFLGRWVEPRAGGKGR
ncbi:Alpha/Beta hydrolase protein [Apodospora peruviana]|uniref:Alpha/Beta hydrolase protein n=1 Tax=Apodospora peruviana TaxID=516989 RepID=A0AAE0M3L4_9PEZI|nr:Alpha/Beta hydrolase protein [Apodospora peruviana]